MVRHIDLAEQLAAIAHEAWRRRMAADGWVPGSVYDGAARVHDALKPFAELDRNDRRATADAIRFEKIEERLAALVDYPRGPDRPFTVDEVRKGLPVELAPCSGSAGPVAPVERGVVESWLAGDDGELRLIRVRWEDGDLSEHHPAARELRRTSSPELPAG